MIDLEHCRIGLSTVTDALGEVVIDALFRERTITVNLMTEVPQTVSALWEELKDPIIERFASQGYELSRVRVSGLGDERFKAFLRGIEPEGVDIKV